MSVELDLKYGESKSKVKVEKLRVIIFATFLLAFFTILPFYKTFVEFTPLYLMKYLSFAFFIIVLASGKKRLEFDSTSFFLIFLIVVFGLISLFNVDINASITTSMYLLIGIGIAVSSELIFRGLSKEVFNKILWAILIAISGLVLIPSLAQSQLSTAYYISTEGRYRFTGIFNNSNELARFCLLGLLISLRMLSIVKKRIGIVFLWLVLGASLYVIHITNSRTSFMIAILGMVVYIFINMYLKSRKTTLIFIYLISLSLLITLIPSLYKYYSALGFGGINQLLSGRLDSWKPVFSQNSIDLFLGAGTVREGLASNVVLVNGYIEIMQYLGLIGLTCWALFIGNMIIKKIRRVYKNPSKSSIQGLSIIFLFMFYYFFEGGLVSIGNLASIYFWLELSQRENSQNEVVRQLIPMGSIRKIKILGEVNSQ
ncbi:O-antigen ligase family protein [Bacillus sp. FJAT-27986]|uniref:O-antigen ligase family protein n=1 Tax=Bacillus sp. FJAT-27986 TaxID=1743146 RepID=UPI00080AD6C3|nr:hypothetical protein [Bacillus sp. FJAT-27986]OCA84611.1 hypothetical protein A8L44_09420 [Bacillus sp. FJAT-27986]